MEARIRIIKRDAGGDTSSLPANQSEKTERERERDMANKVKSWVAEWELRNSALKSAAFSLLRSLETAGAAQ
jgi:hypothetical protein